jgi:hypothetical protein
LRARVFERLYYDEFDEPTRARMLPDLG